MLPCVRSTELLCDVLCCDDPHCAALCYTVVHGTVPKCASMLCIVAYFAVCYWIVLHCDALCYKCCTMQRSATLWSTVLPVVYHAKLSYTVHHCCTLPSIGLYFAGVCFKLQHFVILCYTPVHRETQGLIVKYCNVLPCTFNVVPHCATLCSSSYSVHWGFLLTIDSRADANNKIIEITSASGTQ